MENPKGRTVWVVHALTRPAPNNKNERNKGDAIHIWGGGSRERGKLCQEECKVVAKFQGCRVIKKKKWLTGSGTLWLSLSWSWGHLSSERGGKESAHRLKGGYLVERWERGNQFLRY